MRTATLAAVLAALALVPVANATPSALPTLRFLDLSPVKVSGKHFVAGEQVRVTLRAGTATRVRTVRASSAGAFTVGFGMLREQDRCSGSVAVSAVGGKGDRATYRLPGMACPAMASGPFR
jgi:hypothetical protein